METITIRVRRGGTVELRRLELCGHRLLAGHADTGIFRIVDSESPRPTAQPAKPVRGAHCDDGLATATIEVAEPLALADHPNHGNPYNRG